MVFFSTFIDLRKGDPNGDPEEVQEGLGEAGSQVQEVSNVVKSLSATRTHLAGLILGPH